MAMPVVTVASGGLAVVETTTAGMPISEASNGRGVAVTKVVGKPGWPVIYVPDTGGGGITTITHGSQLTSAMTGPGALGISSWEVMALPGRGYWRGDTPLEFSLASAYTYNNNLANKGGVVPAGGVAIDGFTVPAGVIVVQFRDFSAGNFYLTSSQNYLFRGCRFRGPSVSIGYFNCDPAHTGFLRLHFNDLGGLGSASGDSNNVPIDIKAASGLVIYRNRIQFTTTGIQWNIAAPTDIIENFISDLTTFGTTAHLNGIMSNGGETCCRILRNNVVIQHPDTSGRDVSQTDCIGFFQDFGAFPGTGTNTDSSVGYFVDSNYVGGTGYCFYAGVNPGKPPTSVNNLKFTNNLVTTSVFSTGGSFGPITAEPPWTSQGNAATNNKWNDGTNVGQLAFGPGSAFVPPPSVAVQKNAGSVNLNTSIVTSLPGATTAGNTILIFANGAGTITTPAGFVSRSQQVSNQGLYLFEKLVASGNATDTPTLTMAGAYNAIWQIVEYPGVTAFGTSSGNTAGSTGSGVVATPSITPTAGKRLLVAFMGVTATVATQAFSAGDPQGWTNQFGGQQSTSRLGAASPAGNDSLVSGWAEQVVTASGSTAYSTAAGFFSSPANGFPATIIASYTKL